MADKSDSTKLAMAALWAAAVQLLLLAGAWAFLVFTVPRYIPVFDAQGMALPALTVMVLNLSERVQALYFFGPAAIGAFVAASTVIYYVLGSLLGRFAGRLWSLAVMVAVCLLCAACVLAIFLPARQILTCGAVTP